MTREESARSDRASVRDRGTIFAGIGLIFIRESWPIIYHRGEDGISLSYGGYLHNIKADEGETSSRSGDGVPG